MAEFLSQDEIDALLDIAEQSEDIEVKTNIDEMIGILNYIKNKRLTKIEILLLLTRVQYFLNKEFEEYNISINDAILFHSKASNAILVQEILEGQNIINNIKMPKSSKESKSRLGIKNEDKYDYTLSELSTHEGLQQSLYTLNNIESVDLMNGKITLKAQKEELSDN